jgi:hypothetical protein
MGLLLLVNQPYTKTDALPKGGASFYFVISHGITIFVLRDETSSGRPTLNNFYFDVQKEYTTFAIQT